MANTKNSNSKNSTKNKTTGKMKDLAVNTTNASADSSTKDMHTTSLVSSDESERRDGPGGN